MSELNFGAAFTEDDYNQMMNATQPTEEGNAPSATEVDPEVNETPESYVINGESYTADEVNEWRLGNMRQSDYTKKTQELARLREEHQEAVALYETLRSNPHLIDVLRQAENNPAGVINNYAPTPEREAIKQLMYSQKAMETDIKLKDLHSKYGDFDETALFNTATQMGTDNLEFVLKGLMYDVSAVKTAKNELKKELEENRNVVSSRVRNTTAQNVQRPIRLSTQQEKMAREFGMSPQEYLAWGGK